MNRQRSRLVRGLRGLRGFRGLGIKQSPSMKNTTPNPFAEYEESQFSQETIPLVQRLRKSYDILLHEQMFKVASVLSKYYASQESLFIKDLVDFPSNDKSFKYFGAIYQKSRSFRVIIMNDLIELIRRGEYYHVSRFLHTLIRMQLANRELIRELVVKKSHENMGPEQLLKLLAQCIILQTQSVGDYIYAARVVLLFQEEMNLGISPFIKDPILRGLATCTDHTSIYASFALLKIIQTMDFLDVSSSTVFQILEFFVNNKTIYFSNKFLEMIIERGSLQRLHYHNPQQYSTVMMELINQNLHDGIYDVAFKWWMELTKVISNTDHNIETTYIKLLKYSPNPQTTKQLIKSTENLNIKSTDVTDMLIEKLGTDSKTFNEPIYQKLFRTLTPPMRRSTMSSLLKTFLYQNNESATHKILQLIFKSKNGIEPIDLKSYVDRLLQEGELDKCIQMVEASSISVSRLAYVSVIRYMFENEEDLEIRRSFLEEYSRRALKLRKSDESLAQLGCEIIRYYCNRYSNRAAKKLYTTMNAYTSKPIIDLNDHLYDKLSFAKFKIPNQFKDILTMTQSSRRDSLDIIVSKAIKEQDETTVIWAIDEMRYIGLDVRDILNHLHKRDNSGYIMSILKPEIRNQL
ncbi:uncharacterized protein RJT21DRAFT_15982 [Scheffersomyces amazonensis]|uniref:uncharacterized protein n=1 Tax=Scheffersomyces amazonensis TaxID=1078765 RepID=UPI00315C8D35